MEYVLLILGLFCLVFSIFWIKKAKNAKDLFYAIFTCLGGILMLIVWLVPFLL